MEHYRVNQTDDSKLTVDDETHFDYLTQLVKVGTENMYSGDYCQVITTRKEGGVGWWQYPILVCSLWVL